MLIFIFKVRSIDDTSNFDEFPEVDLKIPGAAHHANNNNNQASNSATNNGYVLLLVFFWY